VESLTVQQRRILVFIEEYWQQQGFSPSYQEIQYHFGFRSPNAVTKHIRRLQDKGWLAVRAAEGGAPARSLVSLRPRPGTVPLVGTIAAGVPIEAIEHIVAELDLSSLGIDNAHRDFFALHVQGESMIEAHVCDGDIAVIKKQPAVQAHEIAAVFWNGEATLKYVRKENDTVRLVPANANMAPIEVRPEATESLRILGKLHAVVRACT
jgi:repressor LexA